MQGAGGSRFKSAIRSVRDATRAAATARKGRGTGRRGRYKAIACRFLLQGQRPHGRSTRRGRAAEVGMRICSLVTVSFEGRQLTGRVNRITKRATVLGADPDGVPYSDGLKYRT